MKNQRLTAIRNSLKAGFEHYSQGEYIMARKTARPSAGATPFSNNPQGEYIMVRKTTRHNHWRKAMPVLALSLAALMPLKQAQAQMPVTDGTLIATTQMSWLTEFAKWTQQLQSWQTQLTNLTNLNFGQLLGTTQLQKIDPNSFAQKACPNTQGLTGMVTSVLGIGNLLNSDMTSNIPQSQYNICLSIEFLQADKYNLTVDRVNRLKGGINDQLNKIENLRKSMSTFSLFGGSGKGNADMNALSNEVQRTQIKMTTEDKDYQARMKADNDLISTLQSMQSTLAHIAMKGQNTLLGNIVQTTALATALSN